MIKIWIIFDIVLVMFNHFTREYTIIVDIIIHEIDTVRYDKNLFLTLSDFLKFFLRFNVNDVTNQHHSLIMLDIIIGSQIFVKIKNTLQSTTAATHDSILYSIACFVSFFAFLRMFSFIITQELIYMPFSLFLIDQLNLPNQLMLYFSSYLLSFLRWNI